jgi:eukaryotic-like serine/threonine-protein kinase
MQNDRAVAHSPDEAGFSLTPGEVVAGRYRIVRLIGRGGMGEVYEAHDSYLKENVALKTLRAGRNLEEAVVKRFHKEVQLARKVTHPNVCRVYETGEHESPKPGQPPLPFFTMQLLTGETLLARIRRHGRLAREEAFPIALQMAEGLQAAHDAGVVHADFKSGNVFLIPSPQGDRVVVTDFGLARVDPAQAPTGETRSMSMEGRIAGTMAYMSPEQITGGPLTAASDIYSLGLVLFEMATGQLPFNESQLVRAAVERAQGEPASARSLVPGLDSKWEKAIGRCLEKEPSRRFARAADLADYFRQRGRLPVRRWRRREWMRAAALAAVLVIAAAAWWVGGHRPSQT